MRRSAITLLAAALLPSIASAGNYATCLLDRLPGVKAPQVAVAAVRSCQDAYPAGPQGVEWGAGKGLFARYKSPDDCLADKARDTALPVAVSHIRNACNWLYGEAPPGLKPYHGPVTPLEPTQR